MQEWLERSDWSKRSPEFGELVLHRDDVHMELKTALPQKLWDVWMSLPKHPHVLRASAVGLLRYAPIDWTYDHWPTTVVASLGVMIAQTYRDLLEAVPVNELAWLSRPFVKIDILGHPRLGFATASGDQLLTEMLHQWPHCDERTLVRVVVQAVRSIVTEMPESIAKVLERASADGYASLAAMQTALRVAGNLTLWNEPRRPDPIWGFLEPGLGYLAAGLDAKAHDCFTTAALRHPKSRAVAGLVKLTSARVAKLPAPSSVKLPAYALDLLGIEHWPPREPLPWSRVESVGDALERDRNFEGALAVYARVRVEDERAPLLARARCYLQLGQTSFALALLGAILERDPKHRDARVLELRALLATKRFDEARAACDAWLATYPDDPEAHYARGKALLGLRRLVEARDALERACTLRPQLTEAMWLRTAVDRSLGRVRAATGVPKAMTDDLPPGELRDALLAGRLADGITMLEREAPSRRLADLYWYAGRYDDAMRIYAAIGDDSGRARCLLDLGRTDEALAILDRIGSDGFTSLRRDRA